MSASAVQFASIAIAFSVTTNIVLFVMCLHERSESAILKSTRDSYSRSIDELHKIVDGYRQRLGQLTAKDSHILQLTAQIRELLSEEEE